MNPLSQEWPQQTKPKNGQFMNFSQGHSETKVQYANRACSDLFSRRFREGISFPKFVQRSILKLPLSKLCAVPLALQNRAVFEGEKRAKKMSRKGEEEGRKRGDQQRGQKGKKDA